MDNSLLPPPDGDRHRGPELLAVFWTECAVALIFVSLRIYSRVMIRGIGYDDWIMFFTMLLFLVSSIIATSMALDGGCRHVYFLSSTQVSRVIKLNWINQTFSVMAIATGKISVAALTLRIMGQSKWRKWFLYFSMVSVFVINAVCCILSFAQCSPPKALWTPGIPANCWNPKSQSDYAIFTSSYNVFLDLCLALLPITIFWRLNMAVRKKIGLSVLLATGTVAAVNGAVKTSKLSALNGRADFTWSTFNLSLWTSAEVFVIIICGCIPTLKPIYDQCQGRHRIGNSYARKQYPSNRSYQMHHESGDRPTRPSRLDQDFVDIDLTELTSRPEPDLWAENRSEAANALHNINLPTQLRLKEDRCLELGSCSGLEADTASDDFLGLIPR